MRKKKKGEILVTKIEIDENTNEPKIVEVPEKEYITPIPKADFVEMKSSKSTSKQMTVEKVFGYKKEENVNKRQKLFKSSHFYFSLIQKILCFYYTIICKKF